MCSISQEFGEKSWPSARLIALDVCSPRAARGSPLFSHPHHITRAVSIYDCKTSTSYKRKYIWITQKQCAGCPHDNISCKLARWMPVTYHPSKERTVCLHGSEELDPRVPPLDATGLAEDKMACNCLQTRERKLRVTTYLWLSLKK